MKTRGKLNFFNPSAQPIVSDFDMANLGAGYDKAGLVSIRKTEYGSAGGTLATVDNQGRSVAVPVITSTSVSTRSLVDTLGGGSTNDIPTAGAVKEAIPTSLLWSGESTSVSLTSAQASAYSLFGVHIGNGARRTQAVVAPYGTEGYVIDQFVGSFSGTESSSPSTASLWGNTVSISRSTTGTITLNLGGRFNISVTSAGVASIARQDTQRIYAVYGLMKRV